MNPIDSNKKFGQFAKEKREALGISQSAAAEMIFGSAKNRGNLSKIENGKKDVTLKTVDRILSAYNSDFEFTEGNLI